MRRSYRQIRRQEFMTAARQSYWLRKSKALIKKYSKLNAFVATEFGADVYNVNSGQVIGKVYFALTKAEYEALHKDCYILMAKAYM